MMMMLGKRCNVKMLETKPFWPNNNENVGWPTKSCHHYTYHNEAKPGAANFLTIRQTSKLIAGGFFTNNQ